MPLLAKKIRIQNEGNTCYMNSIIKVYITILLY